jgi:hypothetical protein
MSSATKKGESKMKTRYPKRELGIVPFYCFDDIKRILSAQLGPGHEVEYNHGSIWDDNVTIYIFCDSKIYTYYSGLLMGWKLAKKLAG